MISDLIALHANRMMVNVLNVLMASGVKTVKTYVPLTVSNVTNKRDYVSCVHKGFGEAIVLKSALVINASSVT